MTFKEGPIRMREEKILRSGYTTGTCAAAAADAAVRMLCGAGPVCCAKVTLPSGGETVIPVEWTETAEGRRAVCAVKKDAGDDPDVTNGTLILASVSLADRILPDKPCYCLEEFPGLYLTGGEGIGLVTKKGLSCPVGFYAINPVPRRMILKAAFLAWQNSGREDRLLLIEISIPEGRVLAEKTFNHNLGIEGGLSVLGTTGIVNPMSEKALIETIRLDIRVRASQGKKKLAVAPGNYGEAFLREELGLSMESFVKCSNFVGDTFRILEEEKIEQVLFAGHLGKLIKVAGGVLNTHSRYGDRRMEILSECSQKAGVPFTVAEQLLSMNTTDEAAEYLERECLAKPVMDLVIRQIQQVLEEFASVKTEVIVFSGTLGILAMTDGAKCLAQELKE